MKTLVFVNPLKPGKLEEYKAFNAEFLGPTRDKYIDLLKRYGLRNAKAYYHKVKDREWVIVVHEAEDDALERLKHFSSSANSYDQWFFRKLSELHDLSENTQPEQLFSFDPVKE